ncbi:MAG: hypothetical protein PVH61_04785 [Candidatus Aminicenantes bacterium]|jgi:hypothetical protein
MARKLEKEDKLDTWQEIANYLDCDIRTCQRNEKEFGLPVYRQKGKKKSRVHAFKNELDEWLEKNSEKIADVKNDSLKENATVIENNSLQEKETVIEDKSSQGIEILQEKNNRFLEYYIGIPIVLIAIIVFFILINQKTSQPADFRIVNSKLIVLDEKGNELWRYDTGIENLANEKLYRDHYQFKRIDGKNEFNQFPFIIIKDVNKDGSNEVLFSTQTQDEIGEGLLCFFDFRGKILWSFQGGRQLTYGEKVYSDYRIQGMEVCDMDNDGNFRIIVISIHRPMFPTQLVVLDLQGNIIGEYWNSGHFNDLHFKDLNGDGRKEIIAAGMNNEYDKGCVVVFDSRDVRGGSPQKEPYYKCNELKPGSEKYYILFPRTDVDQDELAVGNCWRITALKSGHIWVTLKFNNIFFEFNNDFELQGSIQTSHKFELLHQKAVKAGEITSTLDDQYIKDLASRLLYYNGKDWTPNPSMANEWGDN